VTSLDEEAGPGRPDGVVVERAPVYAWARRAVYGGGGVPGRLARGALAPLGWVWGLAAARRLESGAEAGRVLPAPAISVGNVTVGGGGKTSLVEWIVREETAAGVRVAVLSRGYGRSAAGPRAARPGSAASASDVGDEPALLARAGAWVGVSPDRFLAARAVAGLGARAELFVLDDGLQHRSVPRALDLVVFTALDLEAPARCLPAGPLRQAPGWRPPAAAWVVAGADPRDGRWAEHSIGGAYAPWWRELPGTAADWRALPAVTLAAWRAGGETPFDPEGRAVVAFAGVARPESVAELARRTGHDVSALVAFPDHHPYAADDVGALRAAHPGAAFLTTEKDAVKCDPAWFGESPAGVLGRRLEPREPGLLRRLIADAVGDRT
jgi:tetraacyldisaccharide 4'-kinase